MPWLFKQSRCHEDFFLLIMMIILRYSFINHYLGSQFYRLIQNPHGFLNQIWLLIELVSIFILVIMVLGCVVGCAEVAAKFILRRTPWPRLLLLLILRCFMGNHHTWWCFLESTKFALQWDISRLRIHYGLSDLQSLIKFKWSFFFPKRTLLSGAYRALMQFTTGHVYLQI